MILGGCANGIAPLDKMQAYHDFQDDADIVRLHHLKYYGSLIEEFYEVTGSYPFMGEADIPLYVHVANKEQLSGTKQKPPYPIKERSFKEFVALIEQGLGRKINEYYDPQYAADYKPNFYIYMANQGTYFFAIHQHNVYPFSKQIAQHYNKIQISNNPTQQNGAVPTKLLLDHEDFKHFAEQPITKEAFFKEREQKYLHATKE